MEKADKVWIAAAVVVPLVIRDRRHRRKIKDLKNMVKLLNQENEFLHTLVSGLMNPTLDENSAKFLTMLKSK